MTPRIRQGLALHVDASDASDATSAFTISSLIAGIGKNFRCADEEMFSFGRLVSSIGGERARPKHAAKCELLYTMCCYSSRCCVGCGFAGVRLPPQGLPPSSSVSWRCRWFAPNGGGSTLACPLPRSESFSDFAYSSHVLQAREGSSR